MFKTVVILAAGEGLRMRPLSLYLPKTLLPVQDKPIIFHHIERFRKIGVQRIVITVGKEQGSVIETAIRCAYSAMGDIVFVEQDRSQGGGMGHALLQCSRFLKEQFAFVFGDEMPISEAYLDALRRCGEWCVIGVHRAQSTSDILRTATMAIGSDGKITQYVEKPSEGQLLSDYCTSGLYVFDERYVHILQQLQFKRELYVNGEFSIGHSIQLVIDKGVRIVALFTDDAHVHFTTLRDYWDFATRYSTC